MVPVELQDLMIHGLVHQEILTLQGEAVAGELAVVKFGQLYRYIRLMQSPIAKTGPNITYLTKAGNNPSWTTVKSRYWKLMNGGEVQLVRYRYI